MRKALPEHDPSELRRWAEDRLKSRPAAEMPLSESDTQRLLHELRVHQVELEMQNEALQAAQAEIESGQRFTDLYEFAPVGYFSIGCDSKIHLLNQTASSLLGRAREVLTGQCLLAYVAAADVAAFKDFLANIFASNGRASCELSLLAADEQLLDVHIDAVTDEKGLVCNLALSDVSELRRTERRLRQSNDDLKCAQTIAQIGNWRLSDKSGTLLCSEELYRIFGLPQEQALTYTHFLDSVYPEDRAYVEQCWQGALRGEAYDIDHRIVVGKQIKWVREQVSLEFSSQGVLMGGFGTTQDITEHKRLEEDIRRRDKYQRAILDNIPCLVWLKDAESRFLAVNEPFAKAFGFFSPEALIGKDDFSISPPGRAEVYRADDRKVIESGMTVSLVEEIETQAGARWFETYKSPISLDGRIIGTAGFSRDITEQKRADVSLQLAKAEAERANSAKSRFLAAASHDLRQPLSALGLYVGVLKNKLAATEGPLLNNMASCVSSLNELLTDLLDLSKLDAGVVKPEVVDFSVAELIATLISVHSPEAQLKGLSLRWLASELTAHTDPVLYKRLLGNLIANAIRYTAHGGVLVACRRHQGKAWIEIWDTGIGIPADKTNEIFEEFRQLGHDERNRGSGLGLAIVAKSAALLGLQIRLHSRVGKGSMFAVELPLGVARPRAKPRKAQFRALRIALVEDNAGVLNALVCALEVVGHQVIAAQSGDELLQLLVNQAPDIIISDFRLAAGKTGFDVIAAVRKAFGANLPALLITGDTDPKLMRSMADRGILVQHKPVDIDSLQLCIAQATSWA